MGNKLVLKVETGKIDVPDALEKVRAEIVGAMLHGKSVVINLDTLRPNFTDKFFNEEVLPSWVWNYAELAKHENYMKIVKDSENQSIMGDQGNYFRAKSFSLVILCRFSTDDDLNTYHTSFPHGDSFKKYIVQ